MSSDYEERYAPAPKINFNDDNLNPSYYYVDAQLPFSPDTQQTSQATNGYNEYFSNLRNIVSAGSQDNDLHKTSSKTKLIRNLKNRKIIAFIVISMIVFFLLLFVILISVGLGAPCSFNKCSTTSQTSATAKTTNPSNIPTTSFSLSTEITTTKRAISTSHTHIASTSPFDSKIRIWDVTSGELASAYDFSNGGHTNYITVLLPLGNGLLASASLDATIKIWDIYKNSLRKTLEGLSVGHSQQVNCLLLMDNYLASGSDDGSIKIWDLNSLGLYRTVTNGLSKVTILIKLDNLRLVSADNFGYIRVWNVQNGLLGKTFDTRPSLISGLISVSSNAFISTHMDNSMKFFDIRFWNIFVKQVNLIDIKCTVISESSVFVGSNQILIFDAYSGNQINTLNPNTLNILQSRFVKIMALVGSSSLAAVYSDNTIGVYDLGGLYERIRLKGIAKSVNSVLAINENTLASGSDDGLIIVWDLSSGKQIKTLDTGNDVKLLSLIY